MLKESGILQNIHKQRVAGLCVIKTFSRRALRPFRLYYTLKEVHSIILVRRAVFLTETEFKSSLVAIQLFLLGLAIFVNRAFAPSVFCVVSKPYYPVAKIE